MKKNFDKYKNIWKDSKKNLKFKWKQRQLKKYEKKTKEQVIQSQKWWKQLMVLTFTILVLFYGLWLKSVFYLLLYMVVALIAVLVWW